jgi:hypothetical protein
MGMNIEFRATAQKVVEIYPSFRPTANSIFDT